MTKKRKLLIICAVIFIITYLLLPFFVGLLGYGDVRGPRIYPVGYHVSLIRMGYELRFGTKLRFKHDSSKDERKWFYDLNPRNFGGENNR